jgi:NitT/TauT family transport system permease protein
MALPLLRYLPLLLLALCWEAASYLHLVSSLVLPPLTSVAEAWLDLIRDGELLPNAMASLYRGAMGLGLSIVFGSTLGIFMAWWRPLNIVVAPMVEMFYPGRKAQACENVR